jgi:hypothetical protein
MRQGGVAHLDSIAPLFFSPLSQLPNLPPSAGLFPGLDRRGARGNETKSAYSLQILPPRRPPAPPVLSRPSSVYFSARGCLATDAIT